MNVTVYCLPKLSLEISLYYVLQIMLVAENEKFSEMHSIEI